MNTKPSGQDPAVGEGRIAGLTHTAEKTLGEVMSAIHDAEGRLKRTVEDQMHDFERKLRLAADEASLEVRKAAENAKMRIREHPIESVGIGIGAGLVAGVLLGMTLRR